MFHRCTGNMPRQEAKSAPTGCLPQVLFELLTWRLPWTLAGMSPFKVNKGSPTECGTGCCSSWFTLTQCCLPISLQVGAAIRQGGRPEIPPRDALPGSDTATWAGLDDYVQLMR